MSEVLTSARFIRETIFGVRTQREFGELLDYSQSRISRLENGIEPMSREWMERVRALAKSRGVEWDDKWFFEVPDGANHPAGDPAKAA
jgi:transcriptional regulator with XRE-family HTH domain